MHRPVLCSVNIHEPCRVVPLGQSMNVLVPDYNAITTSVERQRANPWVGIYASKNTWKSRIFNFCAAITKKLLSLYITYSHSTFACVCQSRSCTAVHTIPYLAFVVPAVTLEWQGQLPYSSGTSDFPSAINVIKKKHSDTQNYSFM